MMNLKNLFGNNDNPLKFTEATELRRSIYALTDQTTLTETEIQNLVEHATKHTPSAFNSQTSRVVVLLNNHHHKLWDITTDSLKAVVPEAAFAETKAKIDSFKNGHATLMFFEDMSIVEGLQKQFPTYSANFPIWSQQASGMVQFNIWVSLAAEGMGASLQHYNELIEEAVKKEWHLENQWKLIAQMPIGKPGAEAGEKEFTDISSRVKVIK